MENRPEQDKAAENEFKDQATEAAGERYIGETEKNLVAADSVHRSWWTRLWDRILMR